MDGRGGLYNVDVLELEDQRGQVLLVGRVILEDLRPEKAHSIGHSGREGRAPRLGVTLPS